MDVLTDTVNPSCHEHCVDCNFGVSHAVQSDADLGHFEALSRL